MLLKTVNQGGHLAWSNLKSHGCFFATGGFAGADEGNLRIYSFDSSKSQNASLIGQSQASSAFTSLAWDNFGQESSTPLGLIAGGMSDGSVVLWDAYKVIEQGTHDQFNNPQGLLAAIDSIYEGPVNTMEFNPHKTNLLAVGGQDALVINIEKNLSQPQIFSPGNPNLHGDNNITSVSWNRKVPHILASASQDGLTVVWDLKINKSVFSFQDSSAILDRKVSLQWNPEIATQIAVTYDDERVPELQIWDLRNPQGPVVVFNQTHQDGINCLSWCPSDHSLILTGGRDRQVVCWNYKTQEVVSQEYVDYDIVDLKWSNKMPSVYSCVGADGHTEVKSMESSNEVGYAPKWYKPPVAARFGTDGSIATFRENEGNNVILLGSKSTADQEMDTLDEFLQIEDVHKRIDMESNHYASLENPDEEQEFEFEQWKLMRALLSQDVSEYLSTMGFNKKDITLQTENYTGKRHKQAEEKQKIQSNPRGQVQKNTYDFASLSAQDAESFFDQLTVSNSALKEKKASKSKESKETYFTEQVSRNTNWDAGVEKIIKDNLVIGNYDGAIDCSLKCGRSTEALLLAYSQGKDSFESAVNTFLTSQTDQFLKNVFRNIVSKQWEEIAKTYSLNDWRECVAIVISSCDDTPRVNRILLQLGDRFINERKDNRNALLCYTLARNAAKCIPLYFQMMTENSPSSKAHQTQLIKALKYSVAINQLSLLKDQQETYDFMVQISLQLSYCAIAKKRYLTAYHVLSQAPDNKKILTLMDLLYHSPSNQSIQELYEQPPCPYRKENIQIKLKQQQQQPQQQDTKQRQQIFNQNTQFNQPTQPIKQQPEVKKTQNIPPQPPAIQTQPLQKKSPFPGAPLSSPPITHQPPTGIQQTPSQPIRRQVPPPPVAPPHNQNIPYYNIIHNQIRPIKAEIAPSLSPNLQKTTQVPQTQTQQQQQQQQQFFPQNQNVRNPPPVIAKAPTPPPPIQQKLQTQPMQTQQQPITQKLPGPPQKTTPPPPVANIQATPRTVLPPPPMGSRIQK